MYVLKSYKDKQYKKEYIKLHGLHFTEKLVNFALSTIITNNIITLEKIDKWLLDNNKAVSLLNNSTLYDIFYVANIAYANFNSIFESEDQCINYAVIYSKNNNSYEGHAFLDWLNYTKSKDINIDWKKYI